MTSITLKAIRMTAPLQLLDDTPVSMGPLIDSETPHVVDSMSPPHAAECISAQYALAKDTEKLHLINADIGECHLRVLRAQAEIRLLEQKRLIIERRMAMHRARLSPLRSLPDEIFQEIFRHCLPDSRYVVPHVHSAPLVLTRVCRRWRVIAHGTSELWSSISLYDRGIWNPEFEVEMIKQWLSRSRTRPIRMSITCSPHTNFGHDQTRPSSDIFQLAIAHSPQLMDLSLYVNKQYLVHFIESTTLPALRSIHISLHGTRFTEQSEANIRFFAAPNLRSIAYAGGETPMSVIPRDLLPQISNLTLDCNVTLDPALLFANFPNLRHLTIKLSLSQSSPQVSLPFQDHSRIVVPSLSSLKVCLDKDMLDFGDPTRLKQLLDRLEFPALKELSFVAPLGPLSRQSAARLRDHMAWVGDPSVADLLSRSQSPHKTFVCYDFLGDLAMETLKMEAVEVVVVPPKLITSSTYTSAV